MRLLHGPIVYGSRERRGSLPENPDTERAEARARVCKLGRTGQPKDRRGSVCPKSERISRAPHRESGEGTRPRADGVVGVGLERAGNRLLPGHWSRFGERLDGLSHDGSSSRRTGRRGLTFGFARATASGEVILSPVAGSHVSGEVMRNPVDKCRGSYFVFPTSDLPKRALSEAPPYSRTRAVGTLHPDSV